MTRLRTLAGAAVLAALGLGCPLTCGQAFDQCESDYDCRPARCYRLPGGHVCGECGVDADCQADAYCVQRTATCFLYGACPPEGCAAGTVCNAATGQCQRPVPGSDGGPEADAGATPDGGDADGGCTAAFDVSGTFTERYNCEEQAAPDAGVCVDQDQTSTVIVERRASSTPYSNGPEYSIRSPRDGGFSAGGVLCGDELKWGGGESGANAYFEVGTWKFSDAQNFVQPPSSYGRTTRVGSGHCTATGSSVGVPPPPAPVGVCP